MVAQLVALLHSFCLAIPGKFFAGFHGIGKEIEKPIGFDGTSHANERRLAATVIDFESDEKFAMHETGAVELGGGAVGEKQAVTSFAGDAIRESQQKSFL